jgi:transcriptional antiterminator RfaH
MAPFNTRLSPAACRPEMSHRSHLAVFKEINMRIYVAESTIYPRNLIPIAENDVLHVDGGSSWWLYHTRPRQEKCLARDLRVRGVPFYLPLVPRRLVIRGRLVHSYAPLFTGYLFVKGPWEDRDPGIITHRVAQVLRVPDGARLRSDLQKIQSLIDVGAPLTVESRLETNQSVRIRAGALQGLEGIMATQKNTTRIVIWVTMLQQGVSMEIEDCLLEPIESGPNS